MTAPSKSLDPKASGWTSQTVGMSTEILDRMERAVARVRERLIRATSALDAVGIQYAVVGGNAVASWVATVDEGAVRNTRDVELLVRRTDLPAITAALERAGFVAGTLLDDVMFRDGVEGRRSEAVHLKFAGEKAKAYQVLPLPDIETSSIAGTCRVLALDRLVNILLDSTSSEAGMLVRDLVDVGLVNGSWLNTVPAILKTRLQHILDTPDG